MVLNAILDMASVPFAHVGTAYLHDDLYLLSLRGKLIPFVM
jgi:hypothetical protein